MNHDDERDYAEEAANAADMAREQAEELAAEAMEQAEVLARDGQMVRHDAPTLAEIAGELGVQPVDIRSAAGDLLPLGVLPTDRLTPYQANHIRAAWGDTGHARPGLLGRAAAIGQEWARTHEVPEVPSTAANPDPHVVDRAAYIDHAEQVYREMVATCAEVLDRVYPEETPLSRHAERDRLAGNAFALWLGATIADRRSTRD
jgi:hypothetical protein